MSKSILKNVTVSNGSVLDQETDAIFCFRFQDQEEMTDTEKVLDSLVHEQISTALQTKDFQGKAFEIQMLYMTDGSSSKRLFLIGLGNSKKFDLEITRKVGSTVAEKIHSYDIKTASVIITKELIKDEITLATTIKEFLIGMELNLYQFTEFKSTPSGNSDFDLTLYVNNSTNLSDMHHAISLARHFCSGVYLTRDLVNYPPNYATPSFLATQAKNLAHEFTLKCQIIDEEGMKELGMGGLLAVSQGSDEPSKFIVLEHNSEQLTMDTIVLIGKGVTFDSGGISIKPGDGMERMKTDMSGAAAVMGTMKAVALLNLPIHLVVLIPTTENMPSGKSFRPSDVLKMMNGKTVEVINTDSEGRLILADALCYADRYHAKAVIDIATLTGARTVSLGDHAIGLFSNDDHLVDQLVQAGETTYERVWKMPLFSEYRDVLNSYVADLKHMGGKSGGAIVAAKFLEEFVNNYNWAHLDIAGLVSQESGSFYRQGYATGIGTRLLTQFLLNWVN